MARKAELGWLASSIMLMGVAACEGEAPSWVERCVISTRATQEFCECLDERRVIRDARIVVNGGGRLGTRGHIEPRIIEEPDIDDEKACRARILERLSREHPFQ